MPRRKKILSKEESQKVKEKSAMSLQEVNTLEQMLDKDEDKIDLSDIKEILKEPKTEKSSPSLNKINAPQRIPTRLEGSVGNTPAGNAIPNDEENGFNYTSGEQKAGESKYVKYEGMAVNNLVSRRDIENPGRINPFERRSIEFQNTTDAGMSEKNTIEKYTSPRKVDRDKLGKNPFEKKEIKYTPEKY